VRGEFGEDGGGEVYCWGGHFWCGLF
jgi:hypothetical protein